MPSYPTLDALVRARLSAWPQRPPGLPDRRGDRRWLRGRPNERGSTTQPFLKLPGSDRLRTLPDGLWLNFGGTPYEPFVDIFAIEACSSLQNLLDKRSRFAPSTQSLMAVCPVPWLLAPFARGETMPRWKATGILRRAPAVPLVAPVRDLRVMYGLKSRHYEGFIRSTIPQPHEFFVPMESLTAENSDQDPAVQSLVSRASAASNFLPIMQPPVASPPVLPPPVMASIPTLPDAPLGWLGP